MPRKGTLPYIQEYRDRDGVLRRYVRVKGKKLVPLPGRKGSIEFMEAYRTATTKKRVRIPARFKKPFGTIYFAERDGFIKIGYTAQHPQMRMNGLQVGSPTSITLLATMPGGPHMESELHARFAHLKHRGEWFRKETELVEYVSKFRDDEVSNDCK